MLRYENKDNRAWLASDFEAYGIWDETEFRSIDQEEEHLETESYKEKVYTWNS